MQTQNINLNQDQKMADQRSLEAVITQKNFFSVVSEAKCSYLSAFFFVKKNRDFLEEMFLLQRWKMFILFLLICSNQNWKHSPINLVENIFFENLDEFNVPMYELLALCCLFFF